MGHLSRNEDQPGPKPDIVDLNAAVSSLVLSVLQARVAMDRQTAELAWRYQQDDRLRNFDIPSFQIDEISLRLPYATVDVVTPPVPIEGKVGELPHMLVKVDADALAKLPPHAVGYIELKLSQQQLLLPQRNVNAE